MSRAQWIFEYISLVEKEKAERRFQADMLRQTLLSVLGLQIPNQMRGDEDQDAFTPLILLAGNHHLMKAMLDKESGNNTNIHSISDAEYEQQLANMDAGMEPIVDDPFNGQTVSEVLSQQLSKTLVIVGDELPAPILDTQDTPTIPRNEELAVSRLVLDSFDIELLNQSAVKTTTRNSMPVITDE